MKNPIGWYEIYADDLDRARAFYETVLNVTLGELTPPDGGESGLRMLSFPCDFESYGASGALVKMEGMSPGGSGTIVYFACDDCALEESRVAGAGGQVVQSKMSIGEYGYCAMVIDTEGNTIGLHSMA